MSFALSARALAFDAPSDAGAVLVIANITLIGLLPFVFFKPGRRNALWCLTAAAFYVSPVLAGAAALGWAGPMLPEGVARATGVLGVVVSVASVYVVGLAVASHRTALALWHQADDAPVEIVTWGAYRRIRHPFYTGFLLALVAAILVVPSLAMASVAAGGFVAIGLTARHEERRLAASHLGDQYVDYMARSGRFLPNVGRLRSATAVPVGS